MEIISKVSKGSKMDQIYISKNRAGLAIGNYVVVRPLEGDRHEPIEKLHFYGVGRLEPIKLEIIQRVLDIIKKSIGNYENIIITGSFLEEGFNFNDIDILIVSSEKISLEPIKEAIRAKIGILGHILALSNKELSIGMATDPLYQMMLSRCVAEKRFLYKTKPLINYKILDLHLLKSKALINNFDMLSGKEKYSLVRNLVAIYLYLEKRKVSVESVNKDIKKIFDVGVQEIKDNVLDKSFLKKYTLLYNKSFEKILRGIEHGSKQK